jgi:hypothetical protein
MNIKFNRDKTPFGKRVIAANEVTELKAKKQAKKGD